MKNAHLYKIKKVGKYSGLWEPSEEVKEIDAKVAHFASKRLKRAMSLSAGIGIAAPQIGVQRRILGYLSKGSEYTALINPEIQEMTSEQIVLEEGCLSIPGLFLNIERPKEILLKYIDIHGNVLEQEMNGMEARVLLHEIDHLDGFSIFDRVVGEEREKAKQNEQYALSPLLED